VPPCYLDPVEQQRYRELEREHDVKWAARDVDGARAALNEQQRVGSIFPAFVHSFDGEGSTPPVLFHPQLIQDSRTVLEIVRVVSPVTLPELEAHRELLARIDAR
jgi:hypothetical protein